MVHDHKYRHVDYLISKHEKRRIARRLIQDEEIAVETKEGAQVCKSFERGGDLSQK